MAIIIAVASFYISSFVLVVLSSWFLILINLSQICFLFIGFRLGSNSKNYNTSIDKKHFYSLNLLTKTIHKSI